MRMAVQQAASVTASAAARPMIQMKTRIGPVDDPLEREADRIADAVVTGTPVGTISGAPAGGTQRKCAECEEEEKSIQRKCAECEAEDEKSIQRKCETCAAAESHVGAAEMVAKAVSQGGQKLTAAQRAYFEPRFGRDFSDVRIHSGGKAAYAATSINARAYTIGHKIAFAAGEFSTNSVDAYRLMAHELTHVVQQRGSAVPVVRRQPDLAADPDPRARRAAEIAASKTSPGGVRGSLRPFHIVLDNFAIDSAALKMEHTATLAEIVDMVKSAPAGNLRLELTGHTDDTGPEQHNSRLSRKRALAAQRLLRRARVDVVIIGFGEEEPAVGNDTEEGRSHNRRVEIRFLPGPNVVVPAPEVPFGQPAPEPVEPDVPPPEDKKPPEEKKPPEQKKPPEEKKPEEKKPEEEEDEAFCDRHPYICSAIGVVGTGVAVGVGVGIGIRACLSNPLACIGPLLPDWPGGDGEKEPPEEEEPEEKEPPPPHACPIFVRLPSRKLRATPQVDGTKYELRSAFNMTIKFENDPETGCDCSLGEYLQEIRGWAQADVGNGWQPFPGMPRVATGLPIHPTDFQEDGAPEPYGHRYRYGGVKRTPGRLMPQVPQDLFLPDRATGCLYRGSDRAGFDLDDPPPGRYRFHLWFRGAPVDAGQGRARIIPWREWEAVGEMEIPKPPSTTHGPSGGVKKTSPRQASGLLPTGDDVFLLYESGLSRGMFYDDDGSPLTFMQWAQWPIVIRFKSEDEIYTTTIQVSIDRITPTIIYFYATNTVPLNIAPQGHRPIIIKPGAAGAVPRQRLD